MLSTMLFEMESWNALIIARIAIQSVNRMDIMMIIQNRLWFAGCVLIVIHNGTKRMAEFFKHKSNMDVQLLADGGEVIYSNNEITVHFVNPDRRKCGYSVNICGEDLKKILRMIGSEEKK